MLKESVRIAEKNGILYPFAQNGRPLRQKPWLGDLFSPLYDRLMKRSVFPKKMEASYDKHYEILRKMLGHISGKAVVEFAAGSGDAVRFLNRDNNYAGLDISPGLLHAARKKFDRYGFGKYRLYCADACKTPFKDRSFDIALCNLSLNLFRNIDGFFVELLRILKPDGIFYCSVPLPERKNSKYVIHGTLYGLDELQKKIEGLKGRFEPSLHKNGVLLYFSAKFNDQ